MIKCMYFNTIIIKFSMMYIRLVPQWYMLLKVFVLIKKKCIYINVLNFYSFKLQLSISDSNFLIRLFITNCPHAADAIVSLRVIIYMNFDATPSAGPSISLLYSALYRNNNQLWTFFFFTAQKSQVSRKHCAFITAIMRFSKINDSA